MKDCKLIKICLVLLITFFGVSGTYAVNSQPMFAVPTEFCKIFLTRSVNAEVLEPFQEAFELRMKTRCAVSEKWVSQALSPSERKHFIGASKFFVFWLDFDKIKDEAIVGIFSPESGLRIAQSRAKIGNLTVHAVSAIFSDLLDGLLDQIPYVGIWEGPSFYTWSKNSNIRVKAVKAGVPQKHPFLPEEKWIPGENTLSAELSLSKRDSDWMISSMDGKPLSPQNQRVWLFPSR